MRKTGYVVILLVAIAISWELASPWWTLKSMRDAAQARDSERLASYIDFKRLRSGLREQLIELAEAKLPAPAYEAFVRRHGYLPLIDPIVNVIASQSALRAALLMAPPPNGEPTAKGATRKCGIKRYGVRRFHFNCAKLADGQGILVFERRGIGWKLVGIDLPPDYGGRVPSGSPKK